MTWITWRQHRVALAATGTLLGACAIELSLTGLRMRSAQAALTAARCPIAGAPLLSKCGRLENAFFQAGHPLLANLQAVTVGLALLPVLIGMFAGAPLLAREYETGTVRFAWTQAAGRTRWVAGKLTLAGTALAGAAAAFGALASWWLSVADHWGAEYRWQPGQFGLTPVTYAGWMLLAFALGVLAGTLVRRTVPAMAVTGAVLLAVFVVTFKKLDGWLLGIAPVVRQTRLGDVALFGPGSPPVTYIPGMDAVTSVSLARGSWPLRGWIRGPHGQIVNPLPNRWQDLPVPAQNSWLAAHHLQILTAYQPSGRFWLFQAAEGDAMLLLAALAGALTLWLVRRRGA